MKKIIGSLICLLSCLLSSTWAIPHNVIPQESAALHVDVSNQSKTTTWSADIVHHKCINQKGTNHIEVAPGKTKTLAPKITRGDACIWGQKAVFSINFYAINPDGGKQFVGYARVKVVGMGTLEQVSKCSIDPVKPSISQKFITITQCYNSASALERPDWHCGVTVKTFSPSNR